MLTSNGRKRVVVTGFAMLTSLGDAQSTWHSLLEAKSGIGLLTTIDTQVLPVRYGSEITRPLKSFFDKKELRRIGRASQLALHVADDAMSHAGILAELGSRIALEDVAIVLGTTLGPHELSSREVAKYMNNGYKRPNPTTIVYTVPNMPAHHITRVWSIGGPSLTVSSACASGTHAIGTALDQIRLGRSEIVITGGVEALLHDYVIAGFDSMGALAAGFEAEPERASRPFERDRTGFVLGEACAILVMESLEHAVKRGATIWGEVLGYAASSDAYHPAALDPSAKGIVRCMRDAIRDAAVGPEEIGYINAHGTGTVSNDQVETLAIKEIWGRDAYSVPVSSTKSMIGHSMGASGAVEAIATLMALREGMVHPTINYEYSDPVCDLDYVPNESREITGLRTALSNSFGLGGQNASVVLGSF